MKLAGAGFSESEINNIKNDIDHYLKLREVIRQASGETLDLKAYEADMRHLIDTYIEADEPRKISPFGDMSLLDLIVKSGIAEAINSLTDGIKTNKTAVAETIENNIRRKIIRGRLSNPAYYDKMSKLLEEIIADRKARAIEYEEYLKRIAELAKRVESGQADNVPDTLNTPGRKALYDNLNQDEELAIRVDKAVKRKRPDNWRGVKTREQVIKQALDDELNDMDEVERIFKIIYEQREY